MRGLLSSFSLVTLSLLPACGAAAGSDAMGTQTGPLGAESGASSDANTSQSGAASNNGMNQSTGGGGEDAAGGGSSPDDTNPRAGGSGGEATNRAGADGVGGAPSAGAGGVATGGVASGGAATGISGAGGAESTTTVLTAGSGSGGRTCTDSAVTETAGGTVETPAGTFADHCDDAGNLVEYSCEYAGSVGVNCPPGTTGPTRPATGGLPGAAEPLSDIVAPFCDVSTTTGNVIETVTECGGRCSDAKCPNECPTYDEPLTTVSVDRSTGAAVFAFERVGHNLSCELIFDREGDDYSCITDLAEGIDVIAPSLGLSSRFCLEGNIGNIGLNDPTSPDGQECSYRCDVQAP